MDIIEVNQAYDECIKWLHSQMKKQRKRFHNFKKNTPEQRIEILVCRETQQVLAKLSIDIRYKKTLEKDSILLDFFSQDATIEELVKQTDSYKKLEECLLAYRESERSTAVYSRLS